MGIGGTTREAKLALGSARKNNYTLVLHRRNIMWRFPLKAPGVVLGRRQRAVYSDEGQGNGLVLGQSATRRRSAQL